MVIAELWGIKMDFNSIAINYDEISQSVLNIEDKNRKNLFSWNGQFSPQFVEAELNKYAKEDFFVLDTFAGSGTVLYESARKGIKAYGVELNASAYYISKVYELCNLDISEREIIIEDINVILDSLKEKKDLVEYLVSFKYKKDNMKNIIYLLIILMDIYNREKLEFAFFEDLITFRFYFRLLEGGKKKIEEKEKLKEARKKLHDQIVKENKARKKASEKARMGITKKSSKETLAKMEKKAKR